jgi:xanthosine utilization system XapX-like protein
LGGLMFAYSLTVGIGVAILFTLVKSMSPLTLSLVAGFGAMLGDLLVFNLVRKKLKTKISKFYNLLDKKKVF